MSYRNDDLIDEIEIIAKQTGHPLKYKCESELPGDLNGDCLVGLADFAIMAGNWLVEVSKVPQNP